MCKRSDQGHLEPGGGRVARRFRCVCKYADMEANLYAEDSRVKKRSSRRNGELRRGERREIQAPAYAFLLQDPESENRRFAATA